MFELRGAVLELWLSLERLVFWLLAGGNFASSMVVRDTLLDQPEEFLAGQMQNEIFMEMQLKDLVAF